jgi:hypothetical protein
MVISSPEVYLGLEYQIQNTHVLGAWEAFSHSHRPLPISRDKIGIMTFGRSNKASQALAQGLPDGVPKSSRTIADHSGVPHPTL